MSLEMCVKDILGDDDCSSLESSPIPERSQSIPNSGASGGDDSPSVADFEDQQLAPEGHTNPRSEDRSPSPEGDAKRLRSVVGSIPIRGDKKTGKIRYFIIKSLSDANLVTSMKHDCWATTPRNERKLNEAFRSCDSVLLIFSVNGSGKFQGYGRMASEAGNESVQPVQWEGGLHVGKTFRVDWICKANLDFDSTMSIQNPWNEGKPVKIARDGQELHPVCGKRLVDRLDQAAKSLKVPLKPSDFVGCANKRPRSGTDSGPPTKFPRRSRDRFPRQHSDHPRDRRLPRPDFGGRQGPLIAPPMMGYGGGPHDMGPRMRMGGMPMGMHPMSNHMESRMGPRGMGGMYPMDRQGVMPGMFAGPGRMGALEPPDQHMMRSQDGFGPRMGQGTSHHSRAREEPRGMRTGTAMGHGGGQGFSQGGWGDVRSSSHHRSDKFDSNGHSHSQPRPRSEGSRSRSTRTDDRRSRGSERAERGERGDRSGRSGRSGENAESSRHETPYADAEGGNHVGMDLYAKYFEMLDMVCRGKGSSNANVGKNWGY
eukprot:Rmarinus@m.29627